MPYPQGKIAVIAALLGWASVAEAWPPPRTDTVVGTVQAVFADPSDVVIQLDVIGRCGSAFYHIRRTNVNFHELSELARTAIAVNKKMELFLETTCQGDRNILSHGSIQR